MPSGLFPHLQKRHATPGLIAGILVFIWIYLAPIVSSSDNLSTFKCPFNSNLTIVFETLIIFIVGFLSMKLFSGKPITK